MAPPQYKNRRREIYFPSEADRTRWEGLAKAADLPFSKWVYDTIELHLNSGQPSPRAKAVREAADLKKELEHLRGELHVKASLLERYETELYKLRHQSQGLLGGATSQDFSTLADLLKGSSRPMTSQAILKGLHIDPRDSEAAKMVWQQLQMLRQLGFIEETTEGWKWI